MALVVIMDQKPEALVPTPLSTESITASIGPSLGPGLGVMVGRYKLLQALGEGGCGVVYLAEQEEPVKRRVALKVIKPGMDSKQVLARFEAERQALALMDHPNIAKVLDAGATDHGMPYFVMELVHGIRITDYCDRNSLSTSERLELFTQACRAVQHAHQKGIVHRDIKPSNILVALQDGKPAAKVIDFGIAKATAGQVLTDRTVYTAFEQFLGTPTYMSPEQAEVTALDIDTRTDIYSLGVLLYELLTGTTPFDSKRLAHGGLDEFRRIIREEEPPRPSNKLSGLTSEEQTDAARHRHTEAPQLIHLVRGDLDWVVMKALEKDRTRRYETADALAADVERHLRDEPVEAHAPSRVYRLRKLVRRNRLAFAAAALVFAALSAGLGVSLWSLSQAQRESARSRQVAAFLQDMLRGVRPSVALGRDTTMLREILDKTALRLDRELKNQPAVEADLRTTIGAVYLDFGQYAKAETMFRQALSLRRKALGGQHPETAKSLFHVGDVLRKQDHFAESESLFRQALAIQRKSLGSHHAETTLTLNALAAAISQQGRLKEGEALFRESLSIQQKAFGSQHPEIAKTLDDLALVLREQGNYAESEALCRQALSLDEENFGTEHPETASAMAALAGILKTDGKVAEAETVRRRELELRRRLLGNEHPEVADSMMNLATLIADQRRFSEAEVLERDALAMKKRFLGDEHLDVALSISNLGSLLCQEGRWGEAESLYREALAIRRKRLGSQHAHVAYSLSDLAAVLQGEGKSAAAEPLFWEALAIQRKLLGNEHPEVINSIAGLSITLLDEGKFVQAEPLTRELLSYAKKQYPGAWYDFAAQGFLGRALLGQKRYLDAETLLLSAHKGMTEQEKNARPGEEQGLTDALQALVRLYQATGKPAEAARYRHELARRPH